ncbi:MAG: hypothetical protein WCF67_21625 [Chitinophagaceae bacterium]
MNKHQKLLLFTVILFSLAIILIVYRYETLLQTQNKEQTLRNIKDWMPSSKEYTAAEVIELIKNSKEYIGDSISIYVSGDIVSFNKKFQGTLAAVINSKDNMDIVRSSTGINKLPFQYNVYVLAATYYRRQYADEFK